MFFNNLPIIVKFDDVVNVKIKNIKLKMQIINLINLNDNPINFQSHFILNNLEIDYVNLMEVNQGSPLVGKLLFNKSDLFKEILFGGPFLYDNQNSLIYVPTFIRRFCVVGFKLSVINPEKNTINYLGKIEDLIFLRKIENNKIYFYTNIMKNSKSFINI